MHKFFCYNKKINCLTVLISHSDFKKDNFCLPLFLDTYSFLNYKKIHLTLFKKSFNNFSGAYMTIFLKQKGLCYICNKTIKPSECRLMYYKKYNTAISELYGTFLIHGACFK